MRKLMIIVAIVAIGLCSFTSKKVTAPEETGHVKWITWEQAQEAQKKKPKKIFVDVYTDWCGWCKKMDKDAYENPVIAKYLNENYYCIKFNAETHDDITFKGEKYSLDGRYNKLATFLMQNRMSFPTIIYLDEELNLINIIPSYMDAKTLEPVLSFHSTNAYKSTPWDDFQKKFKSNLQ